MGGRRILLIVIVSLPSLILWGMQRGETSTLGCSDPYNLMRATTDKG